MKNSLRPLILALSLGALSLSAAAGAMPAGPGCAPRGHFQPVFSELHDRLKLTPEQETLWAKAESVTKASRADSRQQHEAKRGELRKSLAAGDADLRALARQQDDEMAAGQKRMQAVRDQWLSVYDSLDAGQKRQVQTFLAERLESRDGPGKGRPHMGPRRPGGDGAPPASQSPAAR